MADGDFIRITWESDWPDHELVRGHVSSADAMRAATAAGIAPDCFSGVSHAWARWVPDRTGTFDRRIHNARPNARGAFPVTQLHYKHESTGRSGGAR